MFFDIKIIFLDYKHFRTKVSGMKVMDEG